MAQLLILLPVGIVSGWTAGVVVGGDVHRNLIWGMLGAVIGGIAFPALGIEVGLGNPFADVMTVSILAAMILVGIARMAI